jgi:hypothetical protein
LKKLLDEPRVNAALTALGVACGVLLVAYVVLVPVELILASGGMQSPVIIPSPTARPVVAFIVLTAIASGVLVARDHLRMQERFRLYSLATPVVVLALASSFMVVSRHNEHQFLDAAAPYFPNESQSALKNAGHDDCDWLRGRRWGRPPESLSERRLNRFYAAHRQEARAPTSHTVAESTYWLFMYYTRYLHRKSGEKLTDAGRLRRDVAFVAWFKMCPFQQWVHRPVGGSSD